MAISFNSGSNPSTILYNGNNVTEVLYNGIHVWPEGSPKPVSSDLYWMLNNGTLYLRSTEKGGYTKHNASTYSNDPKGITLSYTSQRAITNIVTEEPILLPKYCHSLFFECRNLETIDVSQWDMSQVYQMAYFFQTCLKLKTITGLDKWNTSSFTQTSGMFEDCYSIEELDLSNWDLSNVEYASQMFNRDDISGWTEEPKLKSIDLSGWDTSKLKACDYMFYRQYNLEHIYVGDKWYLNPSTYWPYSFYMFNGCSSLPNYDSKYVDKTKAYVGTGGYLERK